MREIIKYDNPLLLKPSEEVKDFNDEIKKLVDEMFKVMYASNGVGLAAPQIGIPLRIAVVDVSPAGYEGKVVLINPIIKNKSKKYYLEEEGCLSIPGLYLPTLRHYSISVEYSDFEGRRNIINASGYFAKAIQHEIDHLDGILFVERFEEMFDIEKVQEETRNRIKDVLDTIKNLRSGVK
ncbi:MAG: peptide deformylase [Brevinematales bacterium]|nr:peptide deformylase [Brevinematales bacterium]